MGEAAGHDGVEQPLSRVAEGGVAQIVAQGDGLGQVLVQRSPRAMVRAMRLTSRVWVIRVR